MDTTKTCEHSECNKIFGVGTNKAEQNKRFCSKDCSNKATAKKRADALRAGPNGYKPNVCPCGEYVEPLESKSYNYTKKYCSAEHRSLYKTPAPRDESKWASYTCRACGNAFERRINTRNHKIYCSISCSNKFTKVKKHYGVEGLEIVFDSSYEAFFWGACMIAKIRVERFDRTQGVNWDEDTPDAWYAPDFYLPNLQIAVETKGYEDPDDDTRWAAYRATGKKLIILDRDCLMMVISGRSSLFELLVPFSLVN